MKSLRFPPLFDLFKYSIYALLSFNIYLFFMEENEAAELLFTGLPELTRIIETYTATLDTAAWVILLLLFELETCVLDDDKIVGRVKLALHTTRALCYLLICYAFYGYLTQTLSFYGLSHSLVTDLCSLAPDTVSFMTSLDEFVLIGADNCATLHVAGAPLLSLDGDLALTNQASLDPTRWLAWVDVINSATWLLVVLILEVEVRLQLKGLLTDRMIFATKIVKSVLYSTLLLCAVYWGFKGTFIDFWDAALWIVAFIFIEMNMFEWQEETAHQQAPTA